MTNRTVDTTGTLKTRLKWGGREARQGKIYEGSKKRRFLMLALLLIILTATSTFIYFGGGGEIPESMDPVIEGPPAKVPGEPGS